MAGVPKRRLTRTRRSAVLRTAGTFGGAFVVCWVFAGILCFVVGTGSRKLNDSSGVVPHIAIPAGVPVAIGLVLAGLAGLGTWLIVRPRWIDERKGATVGDPVFGRPWTGAVDPPGVDSDGAIDDAGALT